MKFTRITVRADQMGGVPCIRGLRIPVATVVEMLADGMAAEEILEAYPDLEVDDISESLRFAAEATRERELPLVTEFDHLVAEARSQARRAEVKKADVAKAIAEARGRR